jgi:drug/metabolite transporter (DMT)-like permease
MVGGSATASGNAIGVLLALGAAVCYAIYIPTLERLQQGLTPISTALLVSLGAMIAFMAIAAFNRELTFALHRTAWIAIVILALVSTVAAFHLFLGGLAVLGPVRTAIVSTVEPFAAALLGAALLAQPLTGPTLLGGALIIAAVVLLQRSGRARET